MSGRVEQAVANHKKGYNCAQAVICAYCEPFALDKDMAYRISEGFGRGMGGMRDGVCGAISSMCILVSWKNSGGIQTEPTKVGTYRLVQELCMTFKDKNGSLRCSDLLGLGAPGIKRACDGCIQDVAEILEKYLAAQGVQK